MRSEQIGSEGQVVDGVFDVGNPLPDAVNFLKVSCKLGEVAVLPKKRSINMSLAEFLVRLSHAVELKTQDQVAALQALMIDSELAYLERFDAVLGKAMLQADMHAAETYLFFHSRVLYCILDAVSCSKNIHPAVWELRSSAIEVLENWALEQSTAFFEEHVCPDLRVAFTGNIGWESSVASERWLGRSLELATPPCG